MERVPFQKNVSSENRMFIADLRTNPWSRLESTFCTDMIQKYIYTFTNYKLQITLHDEMSSLETFETILFAQIR